MMYLVEIGEIKDMLTAKKESIRNKIWRKPEWDTSLHRKVEEEWVAYLNGIDCIIITDADIRYEFADIINYSAKGRVCIDLEDLETPYVLMPEELAQKVVVLGSLPDTWCPEKAAS